MDFSSDASDTSWAVVVTQTHPKQDSMKISDRDHEPLALLSASFKSFQIRWPTVENEGFAIVEGINLLEYLLLRENRFSLYTDHQNLQCIFHPARHGVTKRHCVDRLARWSIRISSIPYCTIISLCRSTDKMGSDAPSIIRRITQSPTHGTRS